FGHGTHVAGIIALQAPRDPKKLRIACTRPIAQNLPQWVSPTLAEGATLAGGPTLAGVAPKAGLVSLKVLDDNGSTVSSVILDALNYVREINSDGRNLRIHGVNLSLGCPW